MLVAGLGGWVAGRPRNRAAADPEPLGRAAAVRPARVKEPAADRGAIRNQQSGPADRGWELEEALDQVKELKGLLPIGLYCQAGVARSE